MLPSILDGVRRGGKVHTKAPEPSRRHDILYGNPMRVAAVAALSLGVGALATRTASAHRYSKSHYLTDGFVALDRRKQRGPTVLGKAVRLLFSGSAVLSFSGVADSGLEHYRGSYTNPAMFVAPGISLLSLMASIRQTVSSDDRVSNISKAVYSLSAVTGLAGLGFHLFNVVKRTGGFRLTNLFYGAPLMAPGTQFLAGALGLLAGRLSSPFERERPNPPSGRLLSVGTALALLGTTAEAALLHYRGAFQNPYMILPVTVPPVTAAALVLAATKPSRRTLGTARTLAGATATLGLIGTVFHAYGIHRNMGGWRNWSQMVLQGPPLPAPPGFTGVALASLGALKLIEEDL